MQYRQLLRAVHRWMQGHIGFSPCSYIQNAFQKSGLFLEQAVEILEKSMIERALQATGANQSEASKMLGIHRNTLQRKMVAHEIGGKRPRRLFPFRPTPRALTSFAMSQKESPGEIFKRALMGATRSLAEQPAPAAQTVNPPTNPPAATAHPRATSRAARHAAAPAPS